MRELLAALLVPRAARGRWNDGTLRLVEQRAFLVAVIPAMLAALALVVAAAVVLEAAGIVPGRAAIWAVAWLLFAFIALRVLTRRIERLGLRYLRASVDWQESLRADRGDGREGR